MAFAASFLVVGAAVEGAVRILLGPSSAPQLRVAVAFVAYDIAIGLVLAGAVAVRLHRDRAARAEAAFAGHALEGTQAAPPVSVLVAAYQEEACIAATVRALAEQADVEAEILVGDDGSTDGTTRALVEAFGLVPDPFDRVYRGSIARVSDGQDVPIAVYRFAHAGKAATLNALSRHAAHPVLVTIDADTTPAPHALRHLAGAFTDPDVASAAGVVSLRNGRNGWLVHHQAAEYLKNALVRIGWSSLGALEQVPGAFCGVRADRFAEVSGFPTDSLTEDYELTYRLVDHGVRVGQVPLVVTVPEAQVFTEGPSTLTGFVRQRTRWFAGFLSTLVRFRHLLLDPRAGAFGLVRLPLKVVDAVLPLVAFASLAVLATSGFAGLGTVSAASLLLFGLRWSWDLVVYGLALLARPRLGDPSATRDASPRAAAAWFCTATEALTYVWLKHAATLRGYVWAARRVGTWEASREPEPRTHFRRRRTPSSVSQ